MASSTPCSNASHERDPGASAHLSGTDAERPGTTSFRRSMAGRAKQSGPRPAIWPRTLVSRMFLIPPGLRFRPPSLVSWRGSMMYCGDSRAGHWPLRPMGIGDLLSTRLEGLGKNSLARLLLMPIFFVPGKRKIRQSRIGSSF